MSEEILDVAVVQMVSTDNVAANLNAIAQSVIEASANGAKLIVFPENMILMAKSEKAKLAIAETLGEGSIQQRLQSLASEHKIWLLAGSLPIQSEDASKVYATSILYSDQGQQVAHYQKIHLFDVALDGGEHYRESDSIKAGEQVVVADTPWGKLGLTICYDVRFPELYRELVAQGAQFVCVPAAFTETTGKAHWHTLLRARAIENQLFVLAPNQGGVHANQRATYGHSLIIDPWGEVLAEAGTGPAIVYAQLDLARLKQVRQMIPCLEHRVL